VWFRRRPRYDRREVLERAAREAARGRRRRAVALYRRVLFVEPANVDVHRQLAPLLAETGEPFEAWLSYRAVGRAFERSREFAKAREVYRQAATRLPAKLDAWLCVSRLERRLGDARAARAALLEGRRHQRGRAKRATAIFLLREALGLDPWDPALVLDLAGLLSRSGRREEADLWLEGLASRSRGAPLRRVRSAQLRLSPSLGRAWLWLRAA